MNLNLKQNPFSHGGKRLGPVNSDVSHTTDSVAVEEPDVAVKETKPVRRSHNSNAGTGISMHLIALRNSFVRNLKHSRRQFKHIAREKKANHFPDADNLLIQLVLFAWGMLPALGSKMTEFARIRRRRGINRASQMWHWIERHRLHPAAFLGGGCLVAVAVIICTTYTFGTTVTYDGQVLASVSSASAAAETLNDLEMATARTLGHPFSLDEELLQYSNGLMPREDLVEPEVLSDQLSDQLGLVVNAYCLYVDGVYIGATPYEGALEQLLEQLTLSASDENTISCTFEEEIEIRQQYVAADDVMNLGHLAETLYSTKTAEVTYEVKKGDTWSQIANRHGLTSKELLALNPGYNVDKLQIGEMLTLSASVPYLTMTVMQCEQYVDNVAFDIESTPTSDLYKGDYKVTSKGEYGLADVVANVTYVNGVETQRTILSSVTLKEPVTEYRLEGTKDRPTWHPTGTFRWPTSGRITSYFGGRKSPGGIGSTNHKGMDIAGPRGTAIYAADGGIVTYAGWKGGYGYVVIINHNYNGYETFYAHNSKLLVSVGQKVYKGQQIAKMGSTGNSTGSHCHFEIRYNGVAKNPLNYLP